MDKISTGDQTEAGRDKVEAPNYNRNQRLGSSSAGIYELENKTYYENLHGYIGALPEKSANRLAILIKQTLAVLLTKEPHNIIMRLMALTLDTPDSGTLKKIPYISAIAAHTGGYTSGYKDATMKATAEDNL